ncbi:MAG: hypothetical protein IJ400_05680 [Clostridia bacterium]|nr:hypothetical protein [Clostridia bacterium]
MNQSVMQTLDYYCKNEIQILKNSEYFLEISSLAKLLGYSIDISIGEAMDAKKEKYPKIIYLSFSAIDQQGKIILVDSLDFEHLTDATEILEIDRKNRVKFFSWKDDEEFIESLKWIIKELRKIQNKNT